jgi:hypothetical protein
LSLNSSGTSSILLGPGRQDSFLRASVIIGGFTSLLSATSQRIKVPWTFIWRCLD